MLIGIISDTHDNVDAIDRAVRIFKEYKVDLVLHLGDIVAPMTISNFDGLNIKFVRGNNDGDILNIKKRIEEIGGDYLGDISQLDLDGKSFALYHGTHPQILFALIHSDKYDYILRGHTHKQQDERVGSTRIINPGALYGRAEKSIAVLDVLEDNLEFIDID